MNPVLPPAAAEAPPGLDELFGRTYPDFWERVRAVPDPDRPGRFVGVYV